MESRGFQVNQYLNVEGLFYMIENDVRHGTMVCRKEKCLSSMGCCVIDGISPFQSLIWVILLFSQSSFGCLANS